MRKIENINQGEVIDTIFVFESESEREQYFQMAEKTVSESQAKSLRELRSAYIGNSVKGRKVRPGRRQEAKKLAESINKEYMDQLKKIYELYAGAQARVRIAREHSLLESDLEQVSA